MISIPSILKAVWLVVLFNGNPVTLNFQNTQEFHVRQAWNANGQIIRYVPFAASDVLVAKLLDFGARLSEDYVPVDWAVALSCLVDKEDPEADPFDVLNDVYFINCGQTVIFSTEPGCEDYTPLWRVHYLEFAKGYAFRPIITVADVLDAIDSGELEQIRPVSVLDATIVQDSQRNVIPQAFEFDYAERSIELPLIPVFFKLKFHPRTDIGFILATDTSDYDLATQIGANYSPRLVNLAPDCCDPIYAFTEPATPGQLPIINEVQDYRIVDGLQLNKAYNPFRCWSLFQLPEPDPTAWSLITLKSQATTDLYVEKGIVTPIETSEPIVTNSPSLISMMDGVCER